MELLQEKYKQTEIGLIPSDWKILNLGKSSTLKARIGWQGLTTAEYLKTGEYYLITGTDFKNGFIDWDNCVYVEKERYIQDKNIQVKIDDILVTKDGTIGKVAFVDKISKETTLNSGVFVIRPINKNYNPRYFYYMLMSEHFSAFLNKLTAGSTISHLYQKDFTNYDFPIPQNQDEQIAIATALTNTDIWIKNLEKLLIKKYQIRKGSMQELLKPKEDWEIKKLKDIALIVRGASPRPIEEPKWFDKASPIGWVRISDVTKSSKFLIETTQKLSDLGVKSSRLVEKDNLIMSICATVGRPILTTFNVCIHDGFVVFKNPEVDKEYLYYFLMFIENDWSKNGQTGSQMNLNTGIINNTKIPFPKTKEEQIHIATILSDIDKSITQLETKLEKAKKVKQGMMQELLTGKTRLV